MAETEADHQNSATRKKFYVNGPSSTKINIFSLPRVVCIIYISLPCSSDNQIKSSRSTNVPVWWRFSRACVSVVYASCVINILQQQLVITHGANDINQWALKTSHLIITTINGLLPPPLLCLYTLNILVIAFLHFKGDFVKNFPTLNCISIELNKLI